MSTMVDSATAGPVAPMPFLQRLIGVFTSPRAVFENVRVHPALLGMILFNLFCFVGSYVPIAPIINRVQMEKAQESIEKNENIPQEKRDEIIEQQERMMGSPVMQIVSPAAGAAFVLIGIVLWGWIIQIGVNFMLGGEISFKQAFSTALHIGPILFLAGSVIKVPLVLMTKNLYSATSLALVLPEADPTSMLYAALNTVDIFTIWSLVVLAIAVSALTGMPTKKARAMSILAFVVALVLSVGGAAIGKAAGG